MLRKCMSETEIYLSELCESVPPTAGILRNRRGGGAGEVSTFPLRFEWGRGGGAEAGAEVTAGGHRDRRLSIYH